MSAAATQEVRTGSLYALLLGMMLVVAPHAQRLPVWVSGFVLSPSWSRPASS